MSLSHLTRQQKTNARMNESNDHTTTTKNEKKKKQQNEQTLLRNHPAPVWTIVIKFKIGRDMNDGYIYTNETHPNI